MEIKNRVRYTSQVINLLGKGEVIVLTGHRRAGKSCVLELLREMLAPKGNVIYLDMEDPDNAHVENYRQLNEWLKGKIAADRRNYILIDEVQEIEAFEKTLRYWVKQEGWMWW